MDETKQRKPAGPILYFFCWAGAIWGGLNLLVFLATLPEFARNYAQYGAGAIESLAGRIIAWMIAIFCILEIRATRKARKVLGVQVQGKGDGVD